MNKFFNYFQTIKHFDSYIILCYHVLVGIHICTNTFFILECDFNYETRNGWPSKCWKEHFV